MNSLNPLKKLPQEFAPWLAELHRAEPTAKGVFRLVNIRSTAPRTFEEQRVIVLVLDQNGSPLPNVPVVFGYSTGPQAAPYVEWNAPRPPYRALVVPTQGSGQIDQIQGSAVNRGEPGGITAYVGETDISSDWVSGAGMLQDHTGMHLTFQLELTGVLPLDERLAGIETRLAALEALSSAPTVKTY